MRATIPAQGENKTYAPIPAGTHLARCVHIVDLGTQESEFNGEKKVARKIRITWETPEETTVFKEENGQQPYLVSKMFTLSLHEKASLRKTIESWLGRKLTAKEEEEGYDIYALLGKECIVNIVHNAVGDKTYANVDSVSPLMKGMKAPAQITDSVFFSLEKDEYDELIFEGFGEWLQDIIAKSPEYEARLKDNAKTPLNNVSKDDNDEIDLDEINF